MNRFTTLTTASALLATAGLNGVGAIRGRKEYVAANGLSGAILLIAFFHYLRLLRGGTLNQNNIDLVRHSDWLLTCPLLVVELALLLRGRVEPARAGLAAAASAAMVGFGLAARRSASGTPQQVALWAAGAGMLAVVVAALLSGRKKKRRKRESARWGLLFLLLWVPYGVVFWAPASVRNPVYNVLDMVSKAGLGAVLFALSTRRLSQPVTRSRHV